MHRFSISELMLIVAILGLICSIPFQHQSDQDRQACRFFARFRADQAEMLAIMAEHPAAWMDEFRPELRRRAAWAMKDSRRFSEKVFHDANEVEETAKRNAALGKDRQFWARFDRAAARHGYRKPRVNRGAQVVWGIDGFLVRSWPTYLVLIFLVWALRVAGRSRRKAVTPDL
jgi:hypothetical protein